MVKYEPLGNKTNDDGLIIPREGNIELLQLDMATQEQNHAVLIIGWGEEKETGTKYWICRNSYGDLNTLRKSI